MNWTRGCFRLWIVISALWVSGGTWLLWDELKQIDGSPPPGFSDTPLPPPTGFTLGTGPPPPAGFTMGEPMPRGSVDPATGLDLSGLRPLHSVSNPAEIAERRKHRRDAGIHAALFVFIPPTILLVIGYALAWVAKGFRSAKVRGPQEVTHRD
jgi:hypothetical protein